MDFDNGGLSSSERQRQTAAEIARKKVLAAYSSTVEDIKNLPPSSKDILLHRRKAKTIQPTFTETYSSSQDHPPLSSKDYNIPQDQSYQSAYQQPYSSSPQGYNQEQTMQYQAQYQQSPAQDSSSETFKDMPVNQTAVNEEWQKYHSAWQDYYKNYYSNYYSQAAQTYIAQEKMKDERIATSKTTRTRNFRRLIPIGVLILVVLTGLFLQYNRLIFAPIMAYISPNGGSNASSSIEAVDPSISQTVSPEPRLIIPKLNIDVPVAFGISTSEVDAAMNQGVAQFSIPGANAMPGQIGNLVISGHSAGDIYSNNQYQFIFSGLERLEDGDLIYVNYESVRYTYQMTRREVVEPTNVGALIYETNKPMLTLITCTPLGTSRYRLLITAEQISPEYNEDNTQIPEVPDTPSSTDPEMPANNPSFFENIWNGLFGN